MATYNTPEFMRKAQKKYLDKLAQENPEALKEMRQRHKQRYKERLESDPELKQKELQKNNEFFRKYRAKRKTSTIDNLFVSDEYINTLKDIVDTLPDVTDTPDDLHNKVKQTLTDTFVITQDGSIQSVLEHMVTSNKRQPMSILKTTIFLHLRKHLTYDLASELMNIGKPTLLSIYKALQETLSLPHANPDELAPKPIIRLDSRNGITTKSEVSADTMKTILELLSNAIKDKSDDNIERITIILPSSTTK